MLDKLWNFYVYLFFSQNHWNCSFLYTLHLFILTSQCCMDRQAFNWKVALSPYMNFHDCRTNLLDITATVQTVCKITIKLSGGVRRPLCKAAESVLETLKCWDFIFYCSRIKVNNVCTVLSQQRVLLPLSFFHLLPLFLFTVKHFVTLFFNVL